MGGSVASSSSYSRQALSLSMNDSAGTFDPLYRTKNIVGYYEGYGITVNE